MALSATFQANFDGFVAAVQKADLSLKTFQDNAAKVETQLNKTGNAFSGVKIVQEAQLSIAAVDKLGGVSTLTDQQLRRFAATTAEAAQKVDRLASAGVAVTPEMLKIADSSRAASEALAKAGGNAGGFVDQLKAAIPTSASMGAEIQKVALGFVTGTLALQGFEAAGGAVINFLTSSVKAFAASEDAQRRLTAALRAQNDVGPAMTGELLKLAKAYEQVTVHSDEAIEESMALLIQVGNVLPRQMDQALKATTNLASGLGIDLREATILVSKAFEDNFTALKKAGVQIDASRASAEGMDYVLGQINQRFGGQARAEADSYAGSVKRAANAWDDFKEGVGQVIVQSGPFQTVLAAVNLLLKQQADKAKEAEEAYNRYLAAALKRGVNLQGPQFGKDVPLPLDLSNVKDYAQELENAKAKVAALSAEQRAGLTAGVALGVSEAELGKTYHLTAGEINVFKAALEAAKHAANAQEEALKKHNEEVDKFREIVLQTANTSLAAFLGKIGQTTLAMPAHLVALQAITAEYKTLPDELAQAASAMSHLPLSAEQVATELIKQKAATEDDRAAIERIVVSMRNLSKEFEASISPVGRFLATLQPIQLKLDAMTVAAMSARTAQTQLSPALLANVASLIQTTGSVDKAIAELLKYNAITKDQADAIRAQVKEQKTLDQSLGELSSAFQTLAQISGGAFGSIAKAAGTGIAQVNLISKSFKLLQDAQAQWSTESQHTAQSFGALVAAGASVAAGWFSLIQVGYNLIESYYAQQKAADILALHMKAMIDVGKDFPLLQRQIVAVGGDFGAVAKDAGTSAAAFSDSLISAIQKSEDALKGLFRGATDNLRFAAEALNLAGIIRELGGVTNQNVGLIEDRLSRLFGIIKLGGPTSGQAIGALNAALSEMSGYLGNTGQLWDAAFQIAIKDAKDLGLNLQSINDLMAKQQDNLSKAIGGVTGQIGNQAKKYSDLVTAVKDAQKAYDDLVASGADQKEIALAAEKLAKAQEAVNGAAKTTQEEFDRLSRIALASFNTLVASGKSPIEAMNAIGGSIDDLIANANAFGLSGNAAFAELSRWRGLTKDNADLLTSISSLNDLMVATANLGGLTADGFKDLEAQGLSAYDKLRAAGFTQQEAETAEKPLLESIIKLHKDKGLAIDDATQKLIDQATADGILSGQELSTNQILQQGLGEIITLLGGDLPAAWQTFADAGTTAADKVTGKKGKGGLSDAEQKMLDLQQKLKDDEAWKQWAINAGISADDIKRHIDGIPTSVDVQVNYHDNGGGGGGTGGGTGPGGGEQGGTGGSANPASSGLLITAAMARQFVAGGIVSPSAIQYLASGGHVSPFAGGPQGTDTVPAWLTPGERVLSVTQNRAFETLVKAVPSASSGMVFSAGGPVHPSAVWHLVAGGPVNSAAHPDASSAWSIPALSHGGPIEPAMVRYLAIGGPVSPFVPVQQPSVVTFAAAGLAVRPLNATATDTVRYLSGGGLAWPVMPDRAPAVHALALGGLISVPGRDTYGSPVVQPSAAGLAAGGSVTPEHVQYLSVGAPVQPAILQAVQAFSGGGVPTSVSEPHASSLVQYFSSGAAVSLPTMPGAVSPTVPQYFSAGAVVPPMMPAVQWFSGGGVPTPMMQAFHAASGADARPMPYLAAGGAISLPTYLASGDVAESWIGSAVAPGAPPPLLASASSRPASDRPSTIINVDARGALFPDRASIRDLATLIVKQLPNAATIFVNR